jgi:uncharacterized protein
MRSMIEVDVVKKLVICLIWVGLYANALAAGPASAQTTGSPQAVQAATELASIMSKDLLAQMTNQMTAKVWPQIEAKARGNADAATLTELRGEFERVVVNFVTESLKDMPVIYARYFTVDELHDMAAFYRTPTGQKALQRMPKVLGETYGLLLPRLPSLQQELQQVTVKIMTKHGDDKVP